MIYISRGHQYGSEDPAIFMLRTEDQWQKYDKVKVDEEEEKCKKLGVSSSSLSGFWETKNEVAVGYGPQSNY